MRGWDLRATLVEYSAKVFFFVSYAIEVWLKLGLSMGTEIMTRVKEPATLRRARLTLVAVEFDESGRETEPP